MSLIVNVGTKIMFDRMSNIIKIDFMCVATVISLPAVIYEYMASGLLQDRVKCKYAKTDEHFEKISWFVHKAQLIDILLV